MRRATLSRRIAAPLAPALLLALGAACASTVVDAADRSVRDEYELVDVRRLR